jgi:hypothetical protein
MVGVAQIPGSPSPDSGQTNSSSPSLNGGAPEELKLGAALGEKDVAAAVSSNPSPEVASPARPAEHSAKVRFVAAVVCVVAAICAAGVATLNPGEQPLTLVTFLSAALAAVILLTEAVTSWVVRPRPHSVFDPIPLLGAAMIIAAAITATAVGATSAHGILLITAPLLAVAALCVGNAFVIMGLNATRSDKDFLFPKPLKTNVHVNLGDTVSVKAGEVIPVDGRIEQGSIGVDERVLSPISGFRIREEQEIVHAGSEVVVGSATISALSTVQDSCMAQLQSVLAPMVDESSDGLRSEDSKASRWSALAILFFAATVAISWRERSGDIVAPLLAGGVVMLIGCISQMSEYLYGQRRILVRGWLQRGYLFGFASSVRDIAQVTKIESDPSRCGRLSYLRVAGLEILDDRLDPQALCGFVVALLGRAETREFLAAAEYCRRNTSSLSLDRVLELREYPKRGMSGVVHGVELSIGSEDFLLERGIMMQPTESDGDAQSGSSQMLVAIDDDVVARFWIESSQEDLCSDPESATWPLGIELRQSPGVARELGPESLLIRGNESDLVGQSAQRELSLFQPEEGAIRRSSLIAFTPEIAPVAGLIRSCRAHLRAVDRLRLCAGFGGLLTIVSTFAGAFTPIVPLAWLVLTGIVVRVPVTLSKQEG